MEIVSRLVILSGYVLIGYWLWKEGGEVKEWFIDVVDMAKEKAHF